MILSHDHFYAHGARRLPICCPPRQTKPGLHDCGICRGNNRKLMPAESPTLPCPGKHNAKADDLAPIPQLGFSIYPILYSTQPRSNDNGCILSHTLNPKTKTRIYPLSPLSSCTTTCKFPQRLRLRSAHKKIKIKLRRLDWPFTLQLLARIHNTVPPETFLSDPTFSGA